MDGSSASYMLPSEAGVEQLGKLPLGNRCHKNHVFNLRILS